MNINNLKSMLYLEIGEIENTKLEINNLSFKLDLLSEVIRRIKTNDLVYLEKSLELININLSTIFENNSYISKLTKIFYYLKYHLNDKKEYDKSLKELNALNNVFYEEYKKILFKLEILKNNFDNNKLINYRRILSNFKYNQVITKEQFNIIYEFLKSKKIKDSDIIVIAEKIKNRNFHVCKDGNIPYDFDAKNRFELINMMSMGYEIYENIKLNPKREMAINNNIDIISKLWEQYYNYGITDKFNEQLPLLSSTEYSVLEYKALYHKLMNKIQDKIKSNIDMIMDKEFYLDLSIKNEILLEHRKLISLYNIIRNHFEKELGKVNDLKSEKELKNHLLFSRRSDGISCFFSDLEDIPEEYFKGISNLLESKRNNETGNTKDKKIISNNEFKNLRELKNGQIRIFYRHIKDNYYCILGVAIKKDNNDINLLRRMSLRPIISESTIEKEVKLENTEYERIIGYLEENKRKGNRI